jgi:gamma-tubulin complex component 2
LGLEERRDRESERLSRHRNPAILEPPIEQVAALDLQDGNIEGEAEDDGRKLDGVPLEVQEAWICEDLIFVLQVSSADESC